MKPLLPSLKEKRRYIAFEVITGAQVGEDDVYDAVRASMHQLVGDLGMAAAGLQFVRERWSSRRLRGIARVSHRSVDHFKASLVFVQQVKQHPAAVHSLGVSGILAKAAQQYIAA